jgi:hypothetical protein
MTAAIPLPARGPARVGQATAVEQSRAIAEVQASVLVAMQYPRDVQAAGRTMRDSCSNPRLAAAAFFAFPRGGERVAGPSVHLARELARTWGNLSHGVAEMVRDDEHGQSEMQAYAWDLETNTRVATTFIVPHKRDTKKGVKDLTDMRDIYENNANNGARRVRECIFAVLPRWFTDEAQELCAKTNEGGGGVPLPQRIAKAIEAYGALGISEEQLADRLGRATSRWTGQDLAQLVTLHGSLQRGEVSRDVEFPQATAVTADQLGPAPIPPPGQPATFPAGTTPAQAPASRDRDVAQRHMFALLGDLAVKDRDDRLAIYSALSSRPVGTTDELTGDEIELIVNHLDGVKRKAEATEDKAEAAQDQQAEVGGLVAEGKQIRAAR